MQNFLRVATGATLSLVLAVTLVVPQAQAREGVLSGVASWYGPGFHGRQTANGERYNMNDMTAAHKSLKFGTRVKVTNQTNGLSVVVRINDRGPYVGSRIIDLSKSAALAIDMIGPGTASVTVEVLT
jgi:rare lipoprotein A